MQKICYFAVLGLFTFGSARMPHPDVGKPTTIEDMMRCYGKCQAELEECRKDDGCDQKVKTCLRTSKVISCTKEISNEKVQKIYQCLSDTCDSEILNPKR